MIGMDRIRDLAFALTKKYSTNSPFELCEQLNIQVVYTDLPKKVRGFCVKLLQKHVIVLSQEISEQESRVVCAHELGHYFLHGSMNALELEKYTNFCIQRYEREADCFAAYLLLQEDSARGEDPFEVMTVERIAAINGVPEKLVRLRFSVDKSSCVM